MLCTTCGSPTSAHDSTSTGADAAAADRRREQNRRAQQRFRQKIRQRKAAPEQDQSHSRGSTDGADTSPVASRALTPPSTLCTSPGQPPIARLEDNGGDNVIDWDFFLNTLNTNDRYDIEKGADDFWPSTLEKSVPLDPTTRVVASDLEACRAHHAPREPGDSVDDKESSKAHPGPNVLHRAVQTGNSKVVRLLLEHNADSNSKDDDGLTPLLCAIAGGHEEVLEELLSHGAGIGHVDNDYQSALHWAVLHNRHRILKRLLNCCGRDASLLNGRNKDGETPLSVAVGAGSEVAVKLLLEFGATVNVVD